LLSFQLLRSQALGLRSIQILSYLEP